jgi:hypothetical protein
MASLLRRVNTEVRKLNAYLQLHILPLATKTNRAGSSYSCVPEMDWPCKEPDIKIICNYIKLYVFPDVTLNGKHVEEW